MIYRSVHSPWYWSDIPGIRTFFFSFMCSLDYELCGTLLLRVHSNIQDVFLLQFCWIVIIIPFTPLATAYFMVKKLVKSWLPGRIPNIPFILVQVCCCSFAALPPPGPNENVLGTPLWRAAEVRYGESMTAATWQDIEHSDPLDSQPICSKGLP